MKKEQEKGKDYGGDGKRPKEPQGHDFSRFVFGKGKRAVPVQRIKWNGLQGRGEFTDSYPFRCDIYSVEKRCIGAVREPAGAVGAPEHNQLQYAAKRADLLCAQH